MRKKPLNSANLCAEGNKLTATKERSSGMAGKVPCPAWGLGVWRSTERANPGSCLPLTPAPKKQEADRDT